MIKTVATGSLLCSVLAFCGSIGMAGLAQATLIDFETAPQYPTAVDNFANTYPGVTFVSDGKWHSDDVYPDAFENIDGSVIATFDQDWLSINFQPVVRDVVMDLGADRLRQQVDIEIAGYLDGFLVFSSDFVTHFYEGTLGGLGEVRAQTIGVVDQLRIRKKFYGSGGGVLLDNLSFVPVPEPTSWVVAGIATMSICCRRQRV